MCFPAVPDEKNEACYAHNTMETRAKCWTLSRDRSEEEELYDGQLAQKVSDIESVLQVPASLPTFYLITASGDPYKPGDPLKISNHVPGAGEFDCLNRLLGVNQHSFGMYTTLRPQCSWSYEYDDSLTQLRAIVILVRAPTNSRAVVCVMRVQVSDLSCVSFVSCPRQEDLDDIRTLCGANTTLLRANPLGLLSIIYDHRTRSWETWVTRLWLEVNQIEALTRSAPPEWLMQAKVSNQPTTTNPASQTSTVIISQLSDVQISMDPSSSSLEPLEPVLQLQLQDFKLTPFHDLGNTDKLLPRLYTTDTEISHGQNVMSFAIRYGDFCLDVVKVVDSARRSASLPPQPPGARALVEDRVRFTRSRCHALHDRFAEIRERHRSQINASFSLIAHRESKISLDVARLVAIDSRTMKTIGVLTLIFLPATLVTSLWQADVFHLDDSINAKVYLVTTVTVTAVVFLCWSAYMTFSRKPLHRYDNVPEAPGWLKV